MAHISAKLLTGLCICVILGCVLLTHIYKYRFLISELSKHSVAQTVIETNATKKGSSSGYESNHHDIYHNYSSMISIDDVINFKAVLPSSLPQYKNPCWMEVVPTAYNYSDNYYMRRNCSKPGSVYVYKPKPEMEPFSMMEEVLQTRCPRDISCWRMRCYPYFFLLGMQKAGTTALYGTLMKYHPQILDLTRKESQFWPRYRFGLDSCHAGIYPDTLIFFDSATGKKEATLAEYLDLYDHPAEEIRTQNLDPVQGQIIGEFTPANAWDPGRWQIFPGNENQSEPRVILAHQLYHINPHTKFIFNIRDPVERFISNFYHDKNSPEDMLGITTKAIERFSECMKLHRGRHCVYDIKDNLCKGLYAVYIEDWLEVFPRNQFYFLFFKEFLQNPVEVVNEISHFLQIDPLPQESVDKLNSHSTHQISHNTNAEAIAMLREFYRPWNRKLATLLNDDKYLWDY